MLGTDDVLLVAPARRAFGPLFGIEARLATARDDDVEWPAIMGPVRHSLKIETELFVERTVFDGAGTFTALMTDHHGYLSDATAPIYGAGAERIDGPEVTRSIELVVASIGRRKPLTLYPASFPPEERAGVLTLPSVLALGAYAVQPGPILPRRAGAGTTRLHAPAALEAGRPISYNLGGMRLPAERSPLGAWNRVLGPASSGDAVGRRRRTTLDFAWREYRELAPRFSAGERARLETHFGLVERLGHRLESLATLACEAPAPPAAEFERYDLRFDAFTDIIAAAFSCDITRVVSLSLGEMPTAEFGADHISDKVHKGIAHYIHEDPAMYGAMTDYVRHHAEQVARGGVSASCRRRQLLPRQRLLPVTAPPAVSARLLPCQRRSTARSPTHTLNV